VKNAKALLVAGVIVVLAGFAFVRVTSTDVGTPAATPTASPVAVVTQDNPGTPATGDTEGGVGSSGLPTVTLAALPAEAQRTHALILNDGPYPYPQDDGTFGNREGILPPQEYDWYREYTVPTPGSQDRGARRFVVGQDGMFFYTDDHYRSFREVVE
jgi:ribonuclease T1